MNAQQQRASMEEKVGAVEIEKVATMDAGNLNENASEDLDEDERKLVKKSTQVINSLEAITTPTNTMTAERQTTGLSQFSEVRKPLSASTHTTKTIIACYAISAIDRINVRYP